MRPGTSCLMLLTVLTGPVAAADRPLASFQMDSERSPFVTLSFGDNRCNCLVRTSIPTTILDNSFQTSLGAPSKGSDGRNYYSLPALSLGDLQIPREIDVRCADLGDWSTRYGRRVDGLIGSDLMSKMAVTMDFDTGVVAVFGPDYRPSGAVATIAIIPNDRPHVVVNVCGESMGLTIETANPGEIGLIGNKIDRILELKAGDVLLSRADSLGKNPIRVGSLARAGVAGMQHEGVFFHELGSARNDGEMGLQFLARYNPTFLFASREIVLSKSRWQNGRPWPLLRGMTVVEIDGHPFVFAVQRDSPAKRAGMEPDDELDLPGDFRKCTELWATDCPLPLRVRREGERDFTSIALE